MKKVFQGKSHRMLKTFLLLVCLGLIPGYGIQSFTKSRYPVLGRESVKQIEIMEDHRSALAHWLKKGIKNAVLINLDAHDDVKRLSGIKIQRMRSLLASENKTPANSRYQEITEIAANGNFIYAAVKLGVIKEVYWVVPSKFFQYPDRENQLFTILKFYNFSDEEIQSFRQREGCFQGQVNDVAINMCGVEFLPNFQEPVILSFDVDYAPMMADDYGEKISAVVKQTFRELTAKEYRIRDVVVAYSVNGGHLSSYHRWAGDMIIDFLNNPDLAASTTMPERYNILQKAEQLRLMGRHSELLSYLFPILEKDIYNPSILMYLAYALKGLGATEQSYNCAEKACLCDKNFCYGLCELGGAVLQADGLVAAEKFYTRAYNLNPDMAHGQFMLAQALKKAGRYDDAIEFYNIFRGQYGPFPADFYLGETYILKGDEHAAYGYFNSGGQELINDPHAWSGFGDTGVIGQAIRFYEKKGDSKAAEGLKISLAMKDKNYTGRPHKMMQQ